MKRTFFLAVLVLALILAGCGRSNAASAGDETLALTSWSMNATAWSSPNGATVNISAVPNGYTKGQSAQFCVRLEGDDIASVPCQWNGRAYTASADLNAADGYCYFLILTDTDGSQTEVSVNTPTAVTDDSLINLETALNSYCEITIEEARPENGKLSIVKGSAMIQLPRLTLDEGPVTCKEASLILSYNGEDRIQDPLKVSRAGDGNICHLDLSGTTFAIPKGIADDHQLTLRLDVTLSNGHTLTAPGGTWYYLDGDLVMVVG